MARSIFIFLFHFNTTLYDHTIDCPEIRGFILNLDFIEDFIVFIVRQGQTIALVKILFIFPLDFNSKFPRHIMDCIEMIDLSSKFVNFGNFLSIFIECFIVFTLCTSQMLLFPFSYSVPIHIYSSSVNFSNLIFITFLVKSQSFSL